MSKPVYLCLGIFCLLLAIIGIPLPLLPTTPFVILAAFCFSRSSTRLHQYLLNHRLFGAILQDWERYGCIPLKVKYLSTTMMLTMISYPLFFKDLPLWAKASALGLVAIGLVYIWSRPAEKPQPLVDSKIED